ncbi:unnamed protein product [Phytophthora lilii]|uniref:Unnamed protein product n=1 Tax=Phytophthora lilii TaxID=2077276 RepID=A0A9W6TTY9_9STRA|nr:unnamed protein product [Phytophthora lilii]
MVALRRPTESSKAAVATTTKSLSAVSLTKKTVRALLGELLGGLAHSGCTTECLGVGRGRAQEQSRGREAWDGLYLRASDPSLWPQIQSREVTQRDETLQELVGKVKSIVACCVRHCLG